MERNNSEFGLSIGLNFVASFFVLGLIAGGCSQVKFAKDTTKCDVANPCVTSSGLMHFQQDQLFTTTNRVDILIVDDNSGSMSTEQANLGSPFNGFISRLQSSGIDWQIGVTNTDVCPIAGGFCATPNNISGARGRFVGPYTGSAQPNYGNYILSNGTADVANVFNSTIQRGSEVGSGDERGIYAANLAIDLKDADNAGFFRPASNLAIVFLSDEDERSVGGLTPSDPAYAPLENYDQPQTLMNKVVTAFGGQKSLVANSIVIKSNDSACLSQQAAQGPYYTAHYGTVYEQMSALAQNGSVVGSICDNGAGSFANMLSQVTGAIQSLPLSKNITLSYIPVSTPQVSFTPSSNAVAWSWTPGTNVITLSVRPASGTNVHVEADFNPSAQPSVQRQFKFSPKTLQIGFPSGQVSSGASD